MRIVPIVVLTVLGLGLAFGVHHEAAVGHPVLKAPIVFVSAWGLLLLSGVWHRFLWHPRR